MSEHRERRTDRRAGTSRRRVLAAGAAPVLAAGAPGGRTAAAADGPLPPVPTTEADWAGVAEALGSTGQMKGMLFYLPFPRTDLRVISEGVLVSPALLGLQVGFVRYAD